MMLLVGVESALHTTKEEIDGVFIGIAQLVLIDSRVRYQESRHVQVRVSNLIVTLEIETSAARKSSALNP